MLIADTRACHDHKLTRSRVNYDRRSLTLRAVEPTEPTTSMEASMTACGAPARCRAALAEPSAKELKALSSSACGVPSPVTPLLSRSADPATCAATNLQCRPCLRSERRENVQHRSMLLTVAT